MGRKLTVILVASLAILASGLLFAANTQDPISQGDFAVLLASSLKTATPPAGGWTAANATSFLTGIGLTPLKGTWTPGETLNEGNLVHLLRTMGQPYYSTEPDSVVTWGKAYAVVSEFANFFKTYPVARTSSNDTTTHVYTGIGSTSAGAVAPASPSKP